MLTISLPAATEQNIRQIAVLSGVMPEQVASVLVAASLLPYADPTNRSASPYRTRPDLTQEEYSDLLDSLGRHTPDGAPSLEGVDLRELAYADD